MAGVLAHGALQPAMAADAARGQLLYDTHCIACHTSKMHWRDQRLAKDWNSLTAQVRRWQASVRLNWDADDIANVAAYLNQLYYNFPVQNEDKAISRR